MVRVSVRYLAKRLAYSYLTVVGIIALMFLFANARPGTIADVMATTGMGPEQVARTEQRWAAGEPLWRQFLAYQFNYQTGTLGRTEELTDTVFNVILRRAVPTLILFGTALIFAFSFGSVVGAYLGWHRGSRLDKSLFAGGITTYAAPSFWIAFLLLWTFWAHWDLLPRTHMFTQFPEFEWTVYTTIRDALKHAFLPIATLSLTTWFGVMIVMRTMIVNETSQEYVHLAEAKGLSDRAIMLKHAARNALIPVVTQNIVVVSLLIGGSVIVERVFAWRGLGDLLLLGVEERDIALVLGTFFVLGLFVVVVRLLADVAYTYLDPRVSFGGHKSTGESPPVHYPGRWSAAWGALGYVAVFLSMVPVVAARRGELIAEATVRPMAGNTDRVNWLPEEMRDPLPVSSVIDQEVLGDYKLAGILSHNAQFSSLTMPIDVTGETGPLPDPDTMAMGSGIRSLSVNLLRDAGGGEYLLLFLVPPVVYLLTGVLATRGGGFSTPLGRGFEAAKQFWGCFPLVVLSVFLLAFPMRAGPAGPNPLFSVVFAGIVYPGVFGLLGGYVAEKITPLRSIADRLSGGRSGSTT